MELTGLAVLVVVLVIVFLLWGRVNSSLKIADSYIEEAEIRSQVHRQKIRRDTLKESAKVQKSVMELAEQYQTENLVGHKGADDLLSAMWSKSAEEKPNE